MRVSDKALRELEILLKEDYPDMELTADKLQEIAINLLQNVKLVFGGSHLSKCHLPNQDS